MNASIRNHYLPQFYLKSFTDNYGKLWVYYKDRDEPIQQAPINTAVEKHMYTLKAENGTIDDRIEREMLAPLEGAVSPVIKSLIEKKYKLNDIEKDNLALFMSFMVTRVPRSIDTIREVADIYMHFSIQELAKDPAKIKEAFNHLKGEGKIPDGFNIKDLEKFLNEIDSKYRIEMDKEYATGMSLVSTLEIYKYLLNMNFCLCRAPSGSFFITSDYPLVATVKYPDGRALLGAGFGLPGVEVCFPISPDKCLYLNYNDSRKFWAVHKNFVEKMNRRIAWCAERFIISHLSTKYANNLKEWSKETPELPKMDKEILRKRFYNLKIEEES